MSQQGCIWMGVTVFALVVLVPDVNGFPMRDMWSVWQRYNPINRHGYYLRPPGKFQAPERMKRTNELTIMAQEEQLSHPNTPVNAAYRGYRDHIAPDILQAFALRAYLLLKKAEILNALNVKLIQERELRHPYISFDRFDARSYY